MKEKRFSVKFDQYDEPIAFFDTYEEARSYAERWDKDGYFIQEITNSDSLALKMFQEVCCDNCSCKK